MDALQVEFLSRVESHLSPLAPPNWHHLVLALPSIAFSFSSSYASSSSSSVIVLVIPGLGQEYSLSLVPLWVDQADLLLPLTLL